MKVRLTITHINGEWQIRFKERMEAGLGLRSVQDVAHTLRQEVFFFDAATNIEAKKIQEQIAAWVSTEPIIPYDDGWLQFKVEIVEDKK